MTLSFYLSLSLFLSLSLSLPPQDSVGGVEESISLFADSVIKVFTFGGEAVERCLKLTEGWGLTGLIKALREVPHSTCESWLMPNSCLPSPKTVFMLLKRYCYYYFLEKALTQSPKLSISLPESLILCSRILSFICF